DWNTTTFHAYLSDKHEEMFGCTYAPFRGWQAEKGIIGRLIGTQSKAGTHSKALVKRFIDETFATYNPTPKYPGTRFGFMYTYRKNELQRDRKSTCLNSSHVSISYAVFCLKKKN